MKRALVVLALAAACAACSKPAGQSGTAAQARAAPASPGKQVFDKWCAACHAPGPRYPGTASLAAKYGKEMPAALEERKDLTPEAVALFVRQGVSVMPPFRKTEITNEQLAALGAYLSHQPEK